MEKLEVENQLLQQASDDEFLFRKLDKEDFEKGFLKTLSTLTVVGEPEKVDFEAQFEQMISQNPSIYKVVVIEERISGEVIGCGTIFIEQKFIRNLGKCGHIEDIAIRSEFQGKQLGKRLIEVLVSIGQANNCYKTILDCSEEVVPFYEKCGFSQKGVQMALYSQNT